VRGRLCSYDIDYDYVKCYLKHSAEKIFYFILINFYEDVEFTQMCNSDRYCYNLGREYEILRKCATEKILLLFDFVVKRRETILLDSTGFKMSFSHK
jgi:hypothetical protein